MDDDLEVHAQSILSFPYKHFWSECFAMGTEMYLRYSVMTL